VMMMSIPSSRACNWESVTITAISISASSARLRPVISQSIHTMGSFACVLTRPGYRRTAAAGAASAGLGERVWRVGGCLCARTGGPPARLSLLLWLAPANLAALLRLPLSFVVGGALYVVAHEGVHDVPRRGRADPVGAATVTLTARRRPVTFFLGIVPLSGCSVAGPRRHLLLSHGFLCRSAARGERGRPHHPDGRSAPSADRGWIRRGAYSLGQRERAGRDRSARRRGRLTGAADPARELRLRRLGAGADPDDSAISGRALPVPRRRSRAAALRGVLPQPGRTGGPVGGAATHRCHPRTSGPGSLLPLLAGGQGAQRQEPGGTNPCPWPLQGRHHHPQPAHRAPTAGLTAIGNPPQADSRSR